MEPDPQLYGPELHIHDQAGFVRVAFRLAFWEMLHAPTFEAALVDVANRGGDADTNAAIAGALCGAVAGELEIPDAWKRLVLDALSDDLSSPFATDYHPRVLNDLVASIKPRVSARRW
jgi:ADP-ribosylglycohydrolase